MSSFGAAWWSWADALVSQHGIEGEDSVPFKYSLPGIVATLALILINMVSRDDLVEISEGGEEDVNVGGIGYCCVVCFILCRVEMCGWVWS